MINTSSYIPAINLGRDLQVMDLVLRIEEAIAGKKGLIALSLHVAIEEKQPGNLIITTIRQWCTDNASGMRSMEDLLGVELVGRILNV